MAEHTTVPKFAGGTENIFNNNYSSEDSNDYPDDDPDVVNMGNCYCNGECTPSGLLNITKCRYGAPVFVSLPHFHKADRVVLDAIEGLSPNDRDHSFSITLEPVSCCLCELLKRLTSQISHDRNNDSHLTLRVLCYQDTNFTIVFHPGYS